MRDLSQGASRATWRCCVPPNARRPGASPTSRGSRPAVGTQRWLP